MTASWEWEDYLELAKKLTERSADPKEELGEAYARAAISRAYYAVYHEALALLERWPKNTPEVKKLRERKENSGIHDDLYQFLDKNIFKGSNQHAQNYHHLKSLRVYADYKLVPSPSFEQEIPEKLARDQVANAQKLFYFLQRQQKSTK